MLPIAAALLVAAAIVAVLSPARASLALIAIGLIFALALDPVIRALNKRGMQRRTAVLTVGSALVAGGVLMVSVVGPAAVNQAAQFNSELRETVEGFYGLPIIGDWLEDNDAAAKVRDFVDELPAQIDDDAVSDTANSLVGGALSTVVVFAVALAAMLDGARLVRRVRALIPPRHRDRADRYGRVLYDTFGRYFGGSLTVAVLNGIFILIVGLVLGVPLAPVAAVWAMITNMVPQIGGFLGGSFFTMLALSVSVPVGLVACVCFVSYMTLENHVIQPAVIGRAVDLSPPTTMMAALVGGAAAGLPGALVATPVVGTVKRLYLQFRGVDTADDDDHDEGDDGDPSLIDKIRKRLTGDS